MKTLCSASVLALSVVLSACGQKAETDVATAQPEAANMQGGMDAMANSNAATPAAQTVKGTGTVKAVDKSAGTITLDHGPIPEANWPAMTMAFGAQPAVLDSVKVGDRIAFDLKLEGGAGEVLAVRKP